MPQPWPYAFLSLYPLAGLCLVVVACAGPVGHAVSTPPPFAFRPGATFAVIGMQPRADQRICQTPKCLRDRRIGFGVSARLSQALFDTGLFSQQEEHRVHQRTLREHLLYQYWLEPRTAYVKQDLQRIAEQLEVTLLAYGRLARSRITGSATDVVVWSAAQKTLWVTVEVCLYERAAHAELCGQGEGTAEKDEQPPGIIPIFEIHIDDRGLVNNVAGLATARAIKQAVRQLLTTLQVQP